MMKKWMAVAAAVSVLWWTGALLGSRGNEAEMASGSAAILATEPMETASAEVERVPGELLVDLRDDATPEAERELARRYHLTLEETGPSSHDIKVMKAEVSEADEDAMIEGLSHEPLVESAEPNYVYRALAVPNDPLYKYQWHMDQIHGPKAWDLGQGNGVIVAVIDTGVAYEDNGRFKRAKDLAGTKFVAGWDFIHRNDHPDDDHGHGTHVAGTVAQTTNNNEGVAGVAYKAAIMPIKVLSAQGMGNVGDIAEGIRWAADHGAKVINMSLGGSGFSRVMKNACDYAKQKGVAVVCAAGNNGQQRVSYPAAYPACIAVSATRFDEEVTWYSNYGKEICVAAPGGDTRVDQNGDGYPDGVLQCTISRTDPAQSSYELYQGTSMASPHVAGVAALIISQGIKDPDEVREVLQKTARPKGSGRGDIKYGAGIIDAAAAQRLAMDRAGVRRTLELAGAGAVALLGLRIAAGEALLAGPAALVAACGLWFAPSGWLPVALRHPLAELDTWALGASAQANPIVYSVLLPLVLMVLVFGWRPGRLVAAGLTLGMAAALSDAALFGSTDVAWIPGTAGWLDGAWLLGNAALCLLLARAALGRGRKS
ncbi:MAG: peptidase S8 [Candidatus Wallbacteria bacterium]|nr:peptidase S8 [Candidatus Wallbacteria bacterium]